jgi:hypothetical protein
MDPLERRMSTPIEIECEHAPSGSGVVAIGYIPYLRDRD